MNFLYLFLLLAVCLAPTTIKMYIGFTNFVNNKAPAFVEQVPEIMINDGKVSINEPQPYYIKDPDNGKVLVIIDTTGQITSLKDNDAVCLLTGDKIITRKSKFENRAYDLSNVKSFAVDSERITSWLNIARKFLVIFVYPFGLLVSYVVRIVQALIYAAIGLLFASWSKVKLSYPALLRLAVVAMTPSLLVKTIFAVAGIHLCCFTSLIFLIITLAYLFFAVKAISEMPPISQEAEGPAEITI